VIVTLINSARTPDGGRPPCPRGETVTVPPAEIGPDVGVLVGSRVSSRRAGIRGTNRPAVETVEAGPVK
jgi:hypothetical protein